MGRGTELLEAWRLGEGQGPGPLSLIFRPWAEARALGSRPHGLVSRVGWAE